MRYLLLIPALTLFLSYIPFVHKMEMKEMMVTMKKSGCCKKTAKTQSCHKNNDTAANKGKCAKQDASCVCICCFQYAAPAQLTVKLQFGIDIAQLEPAGYVQHNWKNAQLSAPWQPPDVS